MNLRVLLATLLLAGPAHAAEDGGTLSPLAAGAGNRALAMGGAFTAIADDASAPVWNPAGLALVPRLELQGSRASLYGLEVTEEYASLAWPSWRWGTLAVTARRIGVDAIERRDDRNVLLGSFGASETELDVGWGRSIGPAWSVGGAAKLTRQSLDGRGASGLGFDVGVLVRPGVALGRADDWTGRLSAGLMLRNLVAPSIRLEQDDVSDPAEVRGGVSYRQPLGPARSLRFAADVMHARELDPRLRLGVEITPDPLLALRAGFDGDDFTAGAGIRWRGASFDYAWEANAVDDIHRFGMTLAFGPTVEESRLAARHAAEDEFRARLAETFRRQEEQRIAELLAEGEERFAGGRYEEAVETAAVVRAIAPDEPRAARLEAKALAAHAGTLEAQEDFVEAIVVYGRSLALAPDDGVAAAMARCRAESDGRAERTAQIRARFGEALDRFGAGDLPAARGRLQEILAIAPQDEEARAMLVRTQGAIAARLDDLLARARDAIDRGRLTEAQGLIDAARALDPGAAALGPAVARLRRAERDQQAEAARARAVAASTGAPTTPAVLPPAASRKKQQEIADLYRLGREAMESGRPEDAIRHWEVVWAADPAYESVAEFLKREYLLQGLQAFSRGRLEDAIEVWEKARGVDPSDERTLGYLSRAREQQARSREILGDGTGG